MAMLTTIYALVTAHTWIIAKSLEPQRAWIFNSGASHHIFLDRRSFQLLSRLWNHVNISLANESAIQAWNIGFI
jgi:hypothetical protein